MQQKLKHAVLNEYTLFFTHYLILTVKLERLLHVKTVVSIMPLPSLIAKKGKNYALTKKFGRFGLMLLMLEHYEKVQSKSLTSSQFNS